MIKNKPHIFSVLPSQLHSQFESENFSSFRVDQIYHWLYRHHVNDLNRMHNVPKKVKEFLDQNYSFGLPTIISKTESKDQSTKFLLELSDQARIEMVLMPNNKKITLCVSSQVGCARNCRFCATAKIGFKRNLTKEEIVSQVFIAMQHTDSISNLVFMGMGEPLDNFEQVIDSIRILQHEKMFSFSPRRISLSTCGIVPKIYELADTGLKLKLAVSLNAIFPEKRSYLMPVNKIYPLTELEKALHYFTKKNPYRVTLEYVMIKNFNMDEKIAKELNKFTRNLSCKINLIPWNYVSDSEFLSPDDNEILIFQNQLKQGRVAVTLRQSKGDDVHAACGQLAANYEMSSTECISQNSINDLK